MSRTAEEWGRIAVSLPGWRWMPGMRAMLSSAENGPVPACPDRLDNSEALALETGGRSGQWPDTGDPATEGCLLALLGPRCLVRILPREGRSLCEIVIPGGLMLDDRPRRINGHDLGRACIAAAAAIGRWPGGEE